MSEPAPLSITCTDDSCRFSLESKTALLQHLEEYGFVVVKGVLREDSNTNDEISHAESLFWDFLEHATEGYMRRDDSATWLDPAEDYSGLCTLGSRVLENGIVNKRGVGQSECSWFVRTRPRVRAAFEAVWDNEEELITSFDGFGIMRPWQHGIGTKTRTGWFHVDQGVKQRGKQCVQGLVSLYAQNEATGGFAVIPGSHKRHDAFCEEMVERVAAQSPDSDPIDLGSDYLPLPHDHELFTKDGPGSWEKKLVCCERGDLILWDSRCFHCNTPALVPAILPKTYDDQIPGSEATAEFGSPPKNRLLRAVVYVCMTPKRLCASEQVLKDRRMGYEIRVTTTHWPHRNVMGMGWGKNCAMLKWEEACEERKALIG